MSPPHIPYSLEDHIVNDVYNSLEDRFLRCGKGRRPDVISPPLTNKVLVQLWHLNSRTENPQKKVAEWFKHLYPDLDVEEDCIRLAIYRTAERARRVADLSSYLDSPFDLDFVTADLQQCGLTKTLLLKPEGFSCTGDISLSLTNKAVLDLNVFQVKNNLRHTFTAEWIARLLLLEPGDKLFKILNSKLKKLKDRKRKIQCDKKAPPDALLNFHDELFTHDLVLSNFSMNDTVADVNNSVTPQKSSLSSCNKLKEDLKASQAQEHILKDIVKDMTVTCSKLESELECMKKESVVNQAEQCRKFAKVSKRKHKRALFKLYKQHSLQVKELEGQIKTMSESVVSLKHQLKKKEKQLKGKEKECEDLKNQIAFNVNDNIAEIKDGENNAYSAPVRETVIALMSETGVSAKNVRRVIDIVSQHLFNHKFNKLPSAQCAINMLHEGFVLSNIQVVESAISSNNITLHSDGTSRDGKKIVGHQMSMDDGSVLYLGFVPVASEDAQTLLELSIDCLHRLCSCYDTFYGASDIFKEILPKVTSLMTDRASAMKLYAKKFQEFVESETGKEINVHFLNCNAHFLLGLSAHCDKALSEAEAHYVTETGLVLGRDKDPQFSTFQKEKSATVRLIRMACEILGPRGDQKNGCREQWVAFCENSKIPSFKNNRFNCFFEAAATLVYHYQKLKLFFTSGILHENPNRKIQSVSLDLQDQSLMTFVCCLALFFLKISGPYWALVKSDSVMYCDFHSYVNSLQFYLDKWSNDPSEIVNFDFKSVFPDVNFSSSFYDAVHLYIEEYAVDRSLMTKILQCLCKEYLVVTNRQLADFLVGGKFFDTDELTKSQLKHCSLNNLIGESAFGDFDYDVGKRRNCSLHNRSSVHCIKRNRTVNFVSKKSVTMKKKLFAFARRTAPELKKQSKEVEETVKQKRLEKFVENQQKKIDGQIAEMEKRSKILKDVQDHNGPCESIADIDDLVERSRSLPKPLSEMLKAEIRYQKLIGRKMKFGTVPFMIDALKSILVSAPDNPAPKKRKL